MGKKEYEVYLENWRKGKVVAGGSKEHQIMHEVSQEALRITAELNNSYHEPREIIKIFTELTGKEVDESFGLFPPFYTDCGKNIFIGKNVFINCGCHFQDQGGIYIGDNVLIGSQTVLATINHGTSPDERSNNHLASIHIEKGVWIGSHVTILPGITIGENSIVAAGAVVVKDVQANTVVGGVPATMIRGGIL